MPRNVVNHEIAKAHYFKTQVTACASDKMLFSGLQMTFSTPKTSASLPQYSYLHQLLYACSDFFQQKIARIKENLDSDSIDSDTATAITSVLTLDEYPPPASFTTFEVLTVEEVKKKIAKSPSKFCALDPVPTWLLTNERYSCPSHYENH